MNWRNVECLVLEVLAVAVVLEGAAAPAVVEEVLEDMEVPDPAALDTDPPE